MVQNDSKYYKCQFNVQSKSGRLADTPNRARPKQQEKGKDALTIINNDGGIFT